MTEIALLFFRASIREKWTNYCCLHPVYWVRLYLTPFRLFSRCFFQSSIWSKMSLILCLWWYLSSTSSTIGPLEKSINSAFLKFMPRPLEFVQFENCFSNPFVRSMIVGRYLPPIRLSFMTISRNIVIENPHSPQVRSWLIGSTAFYRSSSPEKVGYYSQWVKLGLTQDSHSWSCILYPGAGFNSRTGYWIKNSNWQLATTSSPV